MLPEWAGDLPNDKGEIQNMRLDTQHHNINISVEVSPTYGQLMGNTSTMHDHHWASGSGRSLSSGDKNCVTKTPFQSKVTFNIRQYGRTNNLGMWTISYKEHTPQHNPMVFNLHISLLAFRKAWDWRGSHGWRSGASTSCTCRSMWHLAGSLRTKTCAVHSRKAMSKTTCWKLCWNLNDFF